MTRLLKSSAAMALVIGLSGCAGSNVGQSISDGFTNLTSGAFFSDEYLSNSNDACLPQRQAMAEHASFFDEELVAATVGGAAAGAIAGGLIAALRGDEIWAGALIGGAVGAAAGYLGKKLQDGQSADSIIGSASNDIRTENRKIDELLGSFRNLRGCRNDQGRAVQASFNAKTIDKTTAQAQMADIRALYNEDVAKFREIANQIAENSDSYAAIYNEVAADNNAQSLEVREYKKNRRSTRVSRKKPKKTAGTPEGSLTASNKSNVKKLQSDCLTNVRKRDECIEEIQTAEKDTGDLELDLG
jgi:uncharacterized membrane protein